jgi:hypothetical protein
MKKFIIRASETVYYWKEVQANSEQELRNDISAGEVLFENDDIVEGDHFELLDITEEIK